MRAAFANAMCEYDTEAELLADLPPTATIGFALDTYNPWLYWPNRGWFPLMPFTPAVGQQLTSQLDPSVPEFEPLAVAGPITQPPGLGPLTYHTVFTETVPGQWLDVQGFIRFYLCGVLDNITASIQNLTGRVVGNDGLDHTWADFASDDVAIGDVAQFEIRGVVGNLDDITAQSGCGSVLIGPDNTVAPGTTIFKITGGIDTILPFDFKIRLISGAGGPTITVTKVVVEAFSASG